MWNKKNNDNNQSEVVPTFTELELQQKLTDAEHKHALEVEKLKHTHSLELQQKDFDLKHYKDEELKKKEELIVSLQQQVAILKKENEMLDKIVDLNGDMVDIKELINSLIKKLPEVNLQNLTINGNN